MAAIRRTPADAAFSHCIRERADWTCERCGKYFPPDSNRRGLHASHFYGRRHKGLRFHTSNCFSHCYKCHQTLGENPADFALWVENHIGSGMYEIIRERKNSIYKMEKNELAEIADHYRQELKNMEQRRAEGAVGYLNFLSWY